MPVYNNVGDTIEGLALDGNTRRWEPKGLVKNSKHNKTMKLFSCDRNSRAAIIKTISEPEDPEVKDKTKDFHRKEGDAVSADAIDLWLDVKGKLSSQVKEGVSGRHGATLFSTAGHSFAVIRTPLQNLLTKLGYTATPLIEK